MSKNITEHRSLVSVSDRERIFGHGSGVVWLTGLSGSGKSTIAAELERTLVIRGIHAYALDGDNVRRGLTSDLGFSDEDRTENIRRIGEAAKLFTDSGAVVVTAFISPFVKDRDRVRALFKPGRFLEVYTRCSLKVCENRDPKGLYAKARAGEITDFTGISSAYEEPPAPELILDTDELSVGECVKRI
ncbi:MAG: adenylyl-sulfate kinase, partial [Pseudomonadota bacterium]